MGEVVKIPCETDKKLQKVQEAYGLKGFAITIKLIQKIVKDNGKFKLNERGLGEFIYENRLLESDKNLVKEVACYCTRIDIFVSSLYDQKKILMLDKSSEIGKINGGI